MENQQQKTKMQTKTKKKKYPPPKKKLFKKFQIYHIYQPLRSGRMWHKVNF